MPQESCLWVVTCQWLGVWYIDCNRSKTTNGSILLPLVPTYSLFHIHVKTKILFDDLRVMLCGVCAILGIWSLCVAFVREVQKFMCWVHYFCVQSVSRLQSWHHILWWLQPRSHGDRDCHCWGQGSQECLVTWRGRPRSPLITVNASVEPNITVKQTLRRVQIVMASF